MGEERSHGATSAAIVRVKWRSRTAGFANGSVESIIQNACKHFKLCAIQPDLVLLAELDGEQLEVTDDLLGLVPKGTTFILSHIQSEDVPSRKQPPLHKRAKQVAIVDHVCTQDPRGNTASSSCIPRAFGMMVFIAPLVGTKFALECEYAETIKDVKAEIEERTGMSRNLQRLLFRGLELQEGCTLSDYNIQKENTLHLLAARSAGSRLVSKWSFLHICPLVGPTRLENGKQRVQWLVSARSDGTVMEKYPNLELSYLFWEAEHNIAPPPSTALSPADARAYPERFDPAHPVLHCDTPTAIILPFAELLPYFDVMLKTLSLHTAAWSDFVTYWLPKLSKQPFVALRFLPQAAYERAAELDVDPKPDVVTRVFILFHGVPKEDATRPIWAAAQDRVGEVDWVKTVCRDEGAWDETRFRVLAWGAMGVL